jgi:microcystin-dependent protein
MTISLKHKFQSAKGDGPDTSLVKPSDWNNEHDLLTDTITGGIVLGRDIGTGPGPVQELLFSVIMPVGVIFMWGTAIAPAGFLLCTGQSLLRTDYTALFGVLGTTYGAADGTHFNLPDLRGRVVAGVDGGAGRLPAPMNALAGVGGESSHVLSLNEMAYHTHGLNWSDPGHAHHTYGWNAGLGGSGSDNVLQDGYAYGQPGNISETVGTGISASIQYAGANYGHNNVQPTIVLNYIIKF